MSAASCFLCNNPLNTDTVRHSAFGNTPEHEVHRICLTRATETEKDCELCKTSVEANLFLMQVHGFLTGFGILAVGALASKIITGMFEPTLEKSVISIAVIAMATLLPGNNRVEKSILRSFGFGAVAAIGFITMAQYTETP